MSRVHGWTPWALVFEPHRPLALDLQGTPVSSQDLYTVPLRRHVLRGRGFSEERYDILFSNFMIEPTVQKPFGSLTPECALV